MSKSNGTRPWGPIKEIPVSDIPPRVISGLWAELYADLLLRLEQTDGKHALAVPFADDKQADAARMALVKYARRQQRSIRVETRKTADGGRTLYVSRGPAWK